MSMMDRGAREANMESAARAGFGKVAEQERKIAQLEAQISSIREARSMKVSYDHEWYLGGIRMKPGVYAIVRISDDPEKAEQLFL